MQKIKKKMQFKIFVLIAFIIALSLNAAAHPVSIKREHQISEPLENVLRHIKNSQIRYARPIPPPKKPKFP